jgi:hypothetical protein
MARPIAVGRPSASRAPRKVRRRRPSSTFLEGSGRRRVEERESVCVAAPHRQLQGETGQVGAGDLGIGKGPAGGVLQLRPQAVGDTGFGAAGPAGPLVGGGLRDADRVQPGEAAAGVVARRAAPAAVDHDAHAVDREARLGDVGGEHDPPPPRR